MSKNASPTEPRASTPAVRPSLHIIQVGEAVPGATATLDRRFDLGSSHVEGPPQGSSGDLAEIADEINRRIDDAGGWILLLRSGETVGEELASEISRAVSERPVAWAYRIAIVEHYRGGPLFRAPRRASGEIRLFHGRRCRFLPSGKGRELQSKGTVIRLDRPLVRERFKSKEEHRRELKTRSLEVAPMSRLARFCRRLWADRKRLTSRSVRFHWIEAGWDLSDES